MGVYQTGSKNKVALKCALEAGYGAVDCAEAYGKEKDVGAAILEFLKAQSNIKQDNGWFTKKIRLNSGYEVTRFAIQGSIKRSKLAYIDLYLLRTPSGGKQKHLECWRAIEDAIDEGEVKAGGVSTFASNLSVVHLLYFFPYFTVPGS